MTRPLLAALAALLAVSCEGPEDGDLTAAAAQPLTAATYAGKTSNPDLFAAVLTNEHGVEAYLCDGAQDFWFRGAGFADGVMTFGDEGEPTLLLQVADGQVQGRLVAVDGSETVFELPEVQGEVLFRAESHSGDEAVLGGWIRLPSGEERGVVRVGQTVRLPSTLNDVCGGCALGPSLTPTPFTPSTATRRVNQVPRVTIIGLGDSFMSGEGAPVVEGTFNAQGTSGTQEQWSDGLPFSPSRSLGLDAATRTRLEREARACHRGAAGLGLAVGDLQRSWPFIGFVHQSFACSGALVKHAIDTGYSGPGGCSRLSGQAKSDCLAVTDDVASDSIQPQLPEALAFLASQQLAPDAVVFSIGGNDLGFGHVIEDCLGSVGGGCEAQDSAARRALAAGTASLPGEYDRLATALTRAGIPDSAVFLTQYPNPLRRTNNDLCAGLEFDDALMRFIADEEAAFAGQVHTTMNQMVTAGANRHGWRLISSHVGTENTHGMCTGSAAWFNDTKSALATQGADLPSPFPGINISAGMVHPNRLGHSEGYKPAYKAALDAMLRTRFTPKVPTQVRVIGMGLEANGDARVTLTWTDNNTIEGYSDVRDANGSRVAGTNADDNTVEFLIDGTTASLSVEACLDTPDLCSPRSAPLEVEVKRPTHRPTDVSAGLGLQASNANPRTLRLTWNDRAPTRMFSTVELEIGTTVTRVAVEGQAHVLPESTNLKRFRVAACNSLGCGPASPWVDFNRPAMQVLPPCENPRLNGCR